jgi:hypothetical protein
MDILNSFPQDKVSDVAGQIFTYIQNEPELTNRSLHYIENLLRKKSFYVMMGAKKHIVGFIAKEKLAGNYYELKCWYIIPSERKKRLSEKIFLAAIQDKKHIYVGVTFQKEIVDKLKQYGFRKISLINLPPLVLFKYLSTRQWRSIIKHLFVRKSYLIIKSN